MIDVDACYALGVGSAADDIAFPCAPAREPAIFGERAMRVLMSSIASISARASRSTRR